MDLVVCGRCVELARGAWLLLLQDLDGTGPGKPGSNLDVVECGAGRLIGVAVAVCLCLNECSLGEWRSE